MDILNLSNKLITGYKEYLKNSIYIKEKNLRDIKWSKGPYLEVIPNFKKTISISEAIQNNLLNIKFEDMFDRGYIKGFDSKSFKLYEHQELAFRKIKNNRNIIVTTGTSSGKTECYLFPIISYLLDEYSKSNELIKGIRAIFIFPMNALANDQYERIRNIFRALYEVLGKKMPFSFGKYTGETKEKYTEAKEQLRFLKDNEVIPGEKIAREQIREDPPNLLITNYSMLEYLLLRPQDNKIFTNEHAGNCKFIVLDEIHVYPGAKGVEIAYLLRRLVHKIKGRCNNFNVNPNDLYSNQPLEKIILQNRDSQNDIIFIGTSATLASDELNYRALSIFSTQLFDAPVLYDQDKNRSDIIQSNVISGFPLDDQHTIREYSLIDLNLKNLMNELVETVQLFDDMDQNQLEDLSRKVENVFKHIPLANLININRNLNNTHDEYLKNIYDITNHQDSNQKLKNRIRVLLFIILYCEKNIRKLFESLKGEVHNREELNQRTIIPGYENETDFYLSLIPLINIANISDVSLFKIRYHLFFKSPAGFFAPLHYTNLISFDRIKEDIDPITGQRYEFFETVFCRNCGQKYIRANFQMNDSKEFGILTSFLSDTREQLNSLSVSELKLKDSSTIDELDEDEEKIIEESKQANQIKQIITLYYSIAEKKIYLDYNKIVMNSEYLELKYFIFDEKKNFQKRLTSCLNCNYASESIVNNYRFVPEDPIHHLNLLLFKELKPSQRKLLTFSDNRQKAAFYAAYMENKTIEKFFRNIFFHILDKKPVDLLRMIELSECFVERHYEKEIRQLSLDHSWLIRNIHHYLIWEFTNIKSRENLEALGLWKIEFNYPSNWQISIDTKNKLQLLNIPELYQLNNDQIIELIKSLLYISRNDFSFALENNIALKDLEKPFLSLKDTYSYSSSKIFDALNKNIKKLVKNWSGVKTKRAEFMRKVLKSLGLTFNDKNQEKEIIVKILDYLFEEIINTKQIMISKEVGLYKISLLAILFKKIEENDFIYQCQQCGKIITSNFNDLCLEIECNGRLSKIKRADAFYNKFTEMYYRLEKFPFVTIEEHTSQLSNQKAREIQDQFKNNEINVISSSTTFEVGIDIGDLNFEFLKNVPPNPSNYIQRVGRIGRGKNSSGSLVLVYCTVNNHDQFFFRDPLKMIRGQIKTIPLNINNEYIARRHLNSEVIAKFWSENPDIKKIADFFDFNAVPPASFAPKFQQFLEDKNDILVSHLKRIFPDTVFNLIGLPSEPLKNLFFDENIFKYFVLCYNTLKEDLESIEKAIKEKRAEEPTADSKGKVKIWERISTLETKCSDLKNQSLIEVFSRFTIIPKYGFPVDTVELYVRDDKLSNEVELSRDLSIAIAEYAPGSEVIVNKMIIKSYALMKPTQKQFEKYEYVYCPKCRYFKEKREQTMDESWKGICYCNDPELKVHEYIIPRYGFTTKKDYTPFRASLNQMEHLYVIQPSVIYDSDQNQITTFLTNQFVNKSGNIYLNFFKPEKAKIVILCKGKNNTGFFICEKCGYLEPRVVNSIDSEQTETEKPEIQKKLTKKNADLLFKKTKIETHETWYLKNCNDPMKRMDLGHSFYTNTFKFTLFFDSSVINSIYRETNIEEIIEANKLSEKNRFDFLEYSFMYAFIYYISFYLQIPRNEISILFKYRMNEGDLRKLEMVIYDNVPGGAGYVDRISKLFSIENNKLSEESIKFFMDMKMNYENCDCKLDTSCYRCIRTRENHEYHDYLRRDVVVKFIDILLGIDKT